MRIANGEQIKKYWLDKCPVCNETVVRSCRCIRSERWCKNEHHWRRTQDGHAIICAEGHTDLYNLEKEGSDEEV